MIRVKRRASIPGHWLLGGAPVWIAICRVGKCAWHGLEPTAGEAGDLGRRHLRSVHR